MIGVLTYDTIHRKTYDTLCLLKARGYKDIKVFAVPMSYKKTFVPLIEHRPRMNMEIPNIDKICRNFQFELQKGSRYEDFIIRDKEIVLLCGAGIIPNTFVKTHNVINAHPGYIPNCRGLDALKWAILENEPIGVTTHLVGDEIDAGFIIESRIIQVESQDSFYSLAQRVYENEISMLVDAIEKVNLPLTYISAKEFVLHRRMPNKQEKQMLVCFERLKQKGVLK